MLHQLKQFQRQVPIFEALFSSGAFSAQESSNTMTLEGASNLLGTSGATAASPRGLFIDGNFDRGFGRMFPHIAQHRWSGWLLKVHSLHAHSHSRFPAITKLSNKLEPFCGGGFTSLESVRKRHFFIKKMSRVFLLACVLLQGAVAAPTFKSVLLTAQYNCVDFLCPDWELDLTRVNPTEPPVQDSIILSNLIPKSPVAAMSFPVLTAYDADPRNFYTVTLPSPTSGDIWEHNVGAAVTNATQVSHSQFKFPDAFGTVSRVHITGNHTLIAVFTTGIVANVNVATGFFIPVGNLSLDQGFKLTQASVVEPTSNVLYAFATQGGKCKLYTHSLVTGQTTSADITLKDIHFELEILFTALWIPTKKAIALFLAGGNEFGLDQIAWVSSPYL